MYRFPKRGHGRCELQVTKSNLRRPPDSVKFCSSVRLRPCSCFCGAGTGTRTPIDGLKVRYPDLWTMPAKDLRGEDPAQSIGLIDLEPLNSEPCAGMLRPRALVRRERPAQEIGTGDPWRRSCSCSSEQRQDRLLPWVEVTERSGAARRDRTFGLSIRSRVLYPLSYRRNSYDRSLPVRAARVGVRRGGATRHACTIPSGVLSERSPSTLTAMSMVKEIEV